MQCFCVSPRVIIRYVSLPTDRLDLQPSDPIRISNHNQHPRHCGRTTALTGVSSQLSCCTICRQLWSSCRPTTKHLRYHFNTRSCGHRLLSNGSAEKGELVPQVISSLIMIDCFNLNVHNFICI